MKEEKIPGSGEGLLHSALLISQAQAPLEFPQLFQDGGPRLPIIPGAPTRPPQRAQRRQGRPRIPGAKGPNTPAHRSEHPGAIETLLGGDERSSKRFLSSQEANNRFMFPPDG